MKILSKKKVEALFDVIMVLDLIASDSIKSQIVGEETNIEELLNTQRIIIEKCADAAKILKGIDGIYLAKEIHTRHNDEMLKRWADKNEAEPINADNKQKSL